MSFRGARWTLKWTMSAWDDVHVRGGHQPDARACTPPIVQVC
jgi:hypothetical protein